jgi:hypothetical protein
VNGEMADDHVQTTEVWSTITEHHDRFASGPTREAAIDNHLRSNRDMKQAITDMARHGPLDAEWANYEYPVIRGVRKTVAVTRTEVTETVESDGMPTDAFGWKRD